ncbi:efflux RND transporter permease subunit [Marinilabilia salmonicolor]|uniref:efflux RND transporter permease subunit n=1 Tax=Marinilabilia salmonicolor TaxID=989 RepID=UPI000469D39C|nr:efflux RND transporter permease subunit [Marinilabilia salmonicolor]
MNQYPDNENDNEKKVERKFAPTVAALKNKNTIFILTAFLFIAGLMSYNSMQRELFPEIVVPYIMISTPYPGNSPLDIENLVTRPIEKELKNLTGVKEMSSASYQDMSLILLEFETDVEVQKALQDTKDQVDKAKSELPDDLETDPITEDLDFSEFPVLNINLSGDYSIYELKKFAEDLQEEFESLREVREADIKGVDEREIKVHVDPRKLENTNLQFSDIEFALMSENVTIGAGEIIVDGTRRAVRTEADYKNMDDIRNTIVKSEAGKVVYLRDIARIIDGFEERSSISRLNKQPVVTLSIVKKGGENLLDATDKIFSIINKKQTDNTLPQDLNITITDDQSVYIRDQISNLENSIIMGMLFVMVVLYLFMGLRNAIFTGLAIPMSMFISFLILGETGYTINTMILFALLMALGMLVDNAIVAVENTYRHFEEGYPRFKAVQKGVSEIAMPIISSTATTLAAFFPLLFWPGIMGEFMKYLPITLIIVLASSLFVALVLNPVFALQFMIHEKAGKEKKNYRKLFIITGSLAFIGIISYFAGSILWGNLMVLPLLISLLNIYILKPGAYQFQHKVLPRLEQMYEATLIKAMGRNTSKWLFFGMILLLFFSIVFYGLTNPFVIFFPDNEPKTVFITMELPLGTDIEKSNEISYEAEAIIDATLQPYNHIVQSVGVNVGNGKGDFFEASRSPNKALTTITFLDYQYRDGISTSQVMKELSDTLRTYTGAKFFVEKEENGPPVGKPVNIEISGNDFEPLVNLATRIKNTIDNSHIEGIENLEMDINMNKPQMEIHIDRDKVRRMGLSTQMVAGALRTALYGVKADTYKDGEDEYDIMIRLDDRFRHDVTSLMNFKIKIEKDGVSYHIPISAVADYTYGSTYEDIKRKDNTRVVTLSSNVIEGYNANQINTDIKKILNNEEIPAGYRWKMTGEQEDQKETSDFLFKALLIAVALIAMILVTQFNSVAKPVIILATVFLSTIGVFMGLGTFQMDFVILMTGVGIVSLAGVVVNNGIVLIDYIDIVRKEKKLELNLSQKEKLSRDDEIRTVIKAGKTRLRPVLLTAITTVLGLLPLATGMNFDFTGLLNNLDPNIYFGGDNADFWPMAWTVIFGLTTATFLTLVMVPVMYNLAIRIRNRVQK